MKDSTILVIFLSKLLCGLVVVVSGVYLILHDHGFAGGWIIFAGILLLITGLSVSNGDKEK